MTMAATQYPLIGVQPACNSSAIGVEVANTTVGYVPLIAVGTIIKVSDPYWADLEVIRLQIPAASAAIFVGTLSVLGATYAYLPLPFASNQGVTVCASLNNIPFNASFVQYAWFVIGGRYVFNSTASVAAGTLIGIAAAGQAGANSISKELVNTNVVLAATTTVVKPANLRNGFSTFTVSNSDGLFVGLALSGTGIPASTSIGAIDAAGTTVSMVAVGTTTPVSATATGLQTVTATYNDATRFWNVVTMSRPFAQGAIT